MTFLLSHFEAQGDGLSNVRQSVLPSVAFRNAAWEGWADCRETTARFGGQDNGELHVIHDTARWAGREVS